MGEFHTGLLDAAGVLRRRFGAALRNRRARGRARWKWLAAIAAVLVLVPPISLALARRYLGAASSQSPSEFAQRASPAARALVERALALPDGRPIADYHAHVVGIGAGASGCEASAKMRTWLHPVLRTQFLFYMDAGGVTDLERADEQYVARLVELASAVRPLPRLGVLAFDRHYASGGARDDEHTALHVPNDYVMRLTAAHSGLFRPVISVHPYRKDALEELDRCAAQGARVLKWLPNAMGIDPADARCDAFYERLQRHGIALLSHTGEENAVDAGETWDLGNPLRLRRALDRGVKVIVAHCATLGESEDLDDPARTMRPAFELFLRLMDDVRYEELVFGELSAACLRNRDPQVLVKLLERTDLHARLVNGSDWPLPAIRVLISSSKLASAGLLTEEERDALDEVYDHNPWLYDLVLKRTLHHPTTGARFPASVFQEHPRLPL